MSAAKLLVQSNMVATLAAGLRRRSLRITPPQCELVVMPRRRTLETGLEARAGSPEAIAARLNDDIAKWTKVIDNAHILKL